MNGLQCINFTCQGESHKATNKVCQDFSLSKVDNNLAYAIVCDGHGGKRYFRSDIGSKICAEVTERCIREFVGNIDNALFADAPYTRVETSQAEGGKVKTPKIDLAFRQLFGAIVSQWNAAITAHAQHVPVTEKEIATVEEKYIGEFNARKNLEKFYGCTLMAYVQTPDYWFAFHLGDGKCIAMRLDLPSLWREPIPWDERCFLNKTTSICDSAALDEFRYCFQGNGHFPDAVFLGSDGMDDSFGPIENLANFYIGVVKEIAREGVDKTRESIAQTLPELSKRGSQDDMSLAVVFNKGRIDALLPQVINFQIADVRKNINEIDSKIAELEEKVTTLSKSNMAVKNNVIQLDYAKKELASFVERRNKLYKRISKLQSELHPPQDVSRTVSPKFRNRSPQDLRRLLSHCTPQSRKLKSILKRKGKR